MKSFTSGDTGRLVIALLLGPTSSFDIAYSNSPAASRASSRSRYS